MIIVRPITQADAETFIYIAFNAGVGMTSMPKNRDILIERIHLSMQSFTKKTTSPGDEFYLFVLEDLETGTIGGTCGMIAQTARNSPLFFYRIEHREKHQNVLHQFKRVPTLRAVKYQPHWSEICSLYISPEFRHRGVGRLLSLNRFLFMAEHPHRFTKKIFAEMRGMFDDTHTSPFWEGIGRHFMDTDLNTFTHMRDAGIVDLTQILPTHPIYIEMLPENVQEALGKVHPESQPALNMLLQEGFYPSSECDICDGGPKIEAELRGIRSFKESIVGPIAEILSEEPACLQCILSNRMLDYRACLAPVETTLQGGVVISSRTAEALRVKVGDRIRYVTQKAEVLP
ncbi:MAG: arginine N-succinyltransferase [Parachlamydiaceae bacterium]